jgi:hypothetical protein
MPLHLRFLPFGRSLKLAAFAAQNDPLDPFVPPAAEPQLTMRQSRHGRRRRHRRPHCPARRDPPGIEGGVDEKREIKIKPWQRARKRRYRSWVYPRSAIFSIRRSGTTHSSATTK